MYLPIVISPLMFMSRMPNVCNFHFHHCIVFHSVTDFSGLLLLGIWVPAENLLGPDFWCTCLRGLSCLSFIDGANCFPDWLLQQFTMVQLHLNFFFNIFSLPIYCIYFSTVKKSHIAITEKFLENEKRREKMLSVVPPTKTASVNIFKYSSGIFFLFGWWFIVV